MAQRTLSPNETRGDAPGNGRLIVGGLLIAVGALLLAERLIGGDIWNRTWPLVIVGVGLALLAGATAIGHGAGGRSVPGAIVTTVGFILLYQNTTGHWESWAYAWALITVAAGLGTMLDGLRDHRPEWVRNGQRTAAVGAVLFAAGVAFFEGWLNLGGFFSGPLGAVAAAVLLIGLGLLVLGSGVLSGRRG
ncbi:MAG: DUF5668 domain-containing protein [Dehalococcoidia bacterium]